MENFKVSIVMPALNEEENIHSALTDTLRCLDEMEIDGEVIVINDGSSDGTEKIIEQFIEKDNRVSTVKHDTPHGIGASFWDGVDRSEGEIVTMIPGDNENDPWEVLRYHKLLGHVDIIIPFVFNKDVRSLFRNALSFAYKFIINTTFLVYFNYTNGTILYRKSLLEELNARSTGFFFQTDILIRVVKKGYLFAEVPYRLDLRNSGESKAVSFPSLLQVVRGYIKLVRDIYFNKKDSLERSFAEGSISAKRFHDK